MANDKDRPLQTKVVKRREDPVQHVTPEWILAQKHFLFLLQKTSVEETGGIAAHRAVLLRFSVVTEYRALGTCSECGTVMGRQNNPFHLSMLPTVPGLQIPPCPRQSGKGGASIQAGPRSI